MDRRTFLRTAAASTGSVAIGGCLDEDDEPISDLGDGPPQYDLPTHASWPPTESYRSDSVVFMQVTLSTVPAVRRAVDDGQIAADQPLQRVPAYSMETVPNAIETVTSYPFAANLRQAVNEAVEAGDDDRATTNQTLVEPIYEPFDGNATTETTMETQPEMDNRTVVETDETTPVGSFGLEVTGVTLIDELLYFQGRFDTAVVSDRYTQGFQRVDEQRGIEIYEHDSGLAFAVSDELLIVPTERDQRTVAPETILAHNLSRYINTVDRVVDDEDGRWLFETTGQTALSLGVWGTDDPVGRLADTVGETPVDDTDPVFGAVENMITALEVTVDESGGVAELEGRFAGLFGDSVPTKADLRSALASGAISEELFVDNPRAHLSASFGER